MPINSEYSEEAVVQAIATALDDFYKSLIANDSTQSGGIIMPTDNSTPNIVFCKH